MKLTTKILKNILKVLNETIEKKSKYRELLRYVLIESDGQELNFMASDIDKSVRLTLRSRSPIFSAAVDFKTLTEAVKLEKNESIEIDFSENYLKVGQLDLISNSNYVDDFHFLKNDTLLSHKNDILLPVKSENFINAIEAVETAASEDETRIYLKSFYLEKNENTNTAEKIITTDGYRLHLVDIRGLDLPLSDNLLIPSHSFKTIKNFLALDEKFSCYSIGTSDFILVNCFGRLHIKALDREFLRYQAVIPKKVAEKIELEKKDILRVLKVLNAEVKNLASTIADKKDKARTKNLEIKFIKDCNYVEIKPSKSTMEPMKLFLHSHCSIDATFGLNIHYFTEAIDSLQINSFTLGYNAELAPVILSAGNQINIVMPVKL
jgi:DNA polymerase III sliding clamp (beta) subunit (PCNA family)